MYLYGNPRLTKGDDFVATIGLMLLVVGVMLFLSATVSFRMGFGGKKRREKASEEFDAEMDAMIKMVKMVLNGLAAAMTLAGAVLFLIGGGFA